MVTAVDAAAVFWGGDQRVGQAKALCVQWCRWLLVSALATVLVAAQAAPMTGTQESGAEPAQGLPGSSGAVRGSTQISTGNRNLDLLLEAGATSAAPSAGAASAASAKGAARPASAPELRSADLRQSIRADLATQSQAKSARPGDAAKSILGLGDTGMAAEAETDPTTRRQWENPTPQDSATARKSSGEGESAVTQAVREAIEFLRSHRAELFAVIGLLLVLALLLKLYIRRT